MSHRDEIVAPSGARLVLTPVSPWDRDGNAALGVVCGVALSVPLWAGLIGVVRALLG